MTVLFPQPMLAQIPIVDDITETATSVVTGSLGWGFEQIAEGIAKWVLGAVGFFVDGTVNFLLESGSPNLTAAWFSGVGSPFATVRGIAGLTLLAFLFLGLIQGLLAGDIGGMIRRMAVDLPGAIVGMAATTVVVDRLLALTDAMSGAVLQNADGQALHFLSGFGVAVSGLNGGFAAVLLGLIAIIAGFLVWVELMIRSVLVYVIVAMSPLAFAATVWPSAKGVLRRMIELLVAVIVSKLVIAITISVGVAALSGAGTATAPTDSPVIDDLAAGMGNLFVGTAILAMAAFSPFLLLKLTPMAEAALVAQGVSRSPVRGAQSAMSNVYYVQSMTRLAGGNSAAKSTSAQHGAPWAVGAGSTGGSASIGAGGASSGGGAAAAGAGPAGVAVAAGTTAVQAGTRAVGQAAQTATDAASGLGGQTKPDRKPGPPSKGERP